MPEKGLPLNFLCKQSGKLMAVAGTNRLFFNLWFPIVQLGQASTVGVAHAVGEEFPQHGAQILFLITGKAEELTQGNAPPWE